jgi:drug/metabolite transporter (DMT)-like permease
VRRLEAADLMLLLTVTIWSLNFTVTKYVLSHGFKPLAYAALRFSAAGLLFIWDHLGARAVLSGSAGGTFSSFSARRSSGSS